MLFRSDLNILKYHRSIDEIMDRFRNTVLVRALAIKGGNITQTAAMLKVHRNTLLRWLNEFGLRGYEDNGKEREVEL